MNRLNPTGPSVASTSGYQEHWALGTTRKVGYVAVVLFVGLGLTGALLTQPGSALFIVSVSGGGAPLLALIPLIIWSVIVTILECKKGDQQVGEVVPNEVDLTLGSEGSLSQEKIPKSSTSELSSYLEGATPKDISKCLKRVPRKFFQEKSQERAKAVFSDAMDQVFGTQVDFPKAEEIPLLSQNELDSRELDPEVFIVASTYGVEKDIPKAALDQDHTHIYQVASQYNAAEAPTPFTPAVGNAMRSSVKDFTQGPLAQRTNPVAFELVTAFLTHLGFNMLNEALPLAGKTYEKNSPILHGYLRPNSENIESLEAELRTNYHLAEYVSYDSLNPEWGEEARPVKLVLQAAPAIGYSKQGFKSDDLQKYAALANYSAIFKYAIECAKSSEEPVVLHMTLVGGKSFGNDYENLSWGLNQAGLHYKEDLKDLGVTVRLEQYVSSKPKKRKN